MVSVQTFPLSVLYGPNVLWTNFVMCQVNFDDHILFNSAPYTQ